MKRLTLLSFLGLLVIIIIVAFSQSPNKYLDYKKGDFPISEKVSNSIISLPMNPYMSDDEINYVVKELKAILWKGLV